VDTVEYAEGRMLDMFGNAARPVVLMWHGAQTDARATMAPLAQRIAEKGFRVVVPDWDSHADDRGRADLVQSLRFAREHNTADAIVLVGWSMGGVAAAGANIHAATLDVRIAHTVCLAGAFMVADPISGQALPTTLSGYRDRAPFTLLHGDADDVIPVTVSREFAASLRASEWPVTIAELLADHGAIAGATYNPALDRYFPADDAPTLAVADEVAARIVDAASN
jgi:dienelactone hydrolase